MQSKYHTLLVVIGYLSNQQLHCLQRRKINLKWSFSAHAVFKDYFNIDFLNLAIYQFCGFKIYLGNFFTLSNNERSWYLYFQVSVVAICSYLANIEQLTGLVMILVLAQLYDVITKQVGFFLGFYCCRGLSCGLILQLFMLVELFIVFGFGYL